MGLKCWEGGGQEVAIFRQTDGKFLTEEIWVVKISDFSLPLNFPKMGDFQPQHLHFWQKQLPTKIFFFDRP